MDITVLPLDSSYFVLKQHIICAGKKLLGIHARQVSQKTIFSVSEPGCRQGKSVREILPGVYTACNAQPQWRVSLIIGITTELSLTTASSYLPLG